VAPLTDPIRWQDVYREAELYKSAVRIYTKPLFQWRKALGTSVDGKTLYDFAEHGLRGLDALHRELERQTFHFRPSLALEYNFNGKHRTLYIPPWKERIVDLLLYRALTERLHRWFTPSAYAYRDRAFSLDQCQSMVSRTISEHIGPVYVLKRDVSNYFASVDHSLLLRQLAELVDPRDYLFNLLEQRIGFGYRDATGDHTAERGIPFGCSIACAFANIYLTAMDKRIDALKHVRYFRYADDVLALASSRDAALECARIIDESFATLRLQSKAAQECDLLLRGVIPDPRFCTVASFRHLGLLFRDSGGVALSRDKSRKIQNLFRFAFRRNRRRWLKLRDPRERAGILCSIAATTIGRGLRNVAILDYYLRHVDDESQLRLLDRWLAEEILCHVFGGHKKGNFRKIAFQELRSMGLPSLVHRRRLLRNGKIPSTFFLWRKEKSARAFRETVGQAAASRGSFLSVPRSSSHTKSVGEDGCL
jgi:hypothetical protein